MKEQATAPGSLACSLVLGAVNIFACLRHPGLTWQFMRRLGYLPNAALPRTYNEKVHWRKLFDRNPLIARLSDKLEAREAFKAASPDIHLPQLLWVGERPEDIPLHLLDRPVVIKTNHGSGYNYFTGQSGGSFEDMCRTVNGWLARYPYGRRHGEWGYYNIRRKVFVEELIEDAAGNKPLMMNFHTFSGMPVMSWVARQYSDRPRQAATYDDIGRRYTQGGETHDALPPDFALPPEYFQALKHSAVLGREIDYARIDFLLCDGKLYGSEFTFYTLGGLVRYHADVTSRLSTTWDMRRSWFMENRQHGWRRIYAACLRRKLPS